MVLLTLNEHEETVIDKIIAAISDYIQIEPMEITPASVLSFPGLEIRQNQRRVFRGGEEVNLTRLEYSTLVFLASNPGIVLTKTHIFEAVWNMNTGKRHKPLSKKSRRCSLSIKIFLMAGTPEKTPRILHGELRFTNDKIPLNTPD